MKRGMGRIIAIKIMDRSSMGSLISWGSRFMKRKLLVRIPLPLLVWTCKHVKEKKKQIMDRNSIIRSQEQNYIQEIPKDPKFF
jgi:hypothetical protein